MAYSKEQIEEAFERIIKGIAEDGRSLRSMLLEDGMPSSQTFYIWLESDENKSKQYARACVLRGDAKFEDIENDYNEEPQRDAETGKIDTGWVQLQRLKIDTKKWEASKLNPKKYGNKVDVTSGGEKMQQPIISIDPLKDD